MQLPFRESRNGRASVAVQNATCAVAVQQLAYQAVACVVCRFAGLVQCRQLRFGAAAKPVDDRALIASAELIILQKMLYGVCHRLVALGLGNELRQAVEAIGV